MKPMPAPSRRIAVAALILAAGLQPTASAWADACPEPNNGRESACFLPADTPVQGVMGADGDIDAYRIEVPVAGTRLRLELTDLPLDYELYLADGGDDVIGQSEREGPVSEAIELTLQTAGNYYAYV